METGLKLLLTIALMLGAISLQSRTLRSSYKALEPAQQRLATINTARTWENLGFQNLTARFLWLDFIQFYGLNIIRNPGEAGLRRRYHEISYDYLETITRLDPRFILPYTVALNAVGWKQGRPDLARLLLIRAHIHRNEFNHQDLAFFPLINLNLSLIYLLIYASPESVEFTFEAIASWVENSPLQVQAITLIEPESVRMTGKNLASRLKEDPVYAEFLGWQQVYLGADDPEIKAIGRQELERIGATFTQALDGRIIPIPPPSPEGLRRRELYLQQGVRD